MTIYYADLGKTETGDGSFSNQWGKDEWYLQTPINNNVDELQIQGSASYSSNIIVCNGAFASRWSLITSQNSAVPFRINMPSNDIYFWDSNNSGAWMVTNCIIYCLDLYLGQFSHSFVFARTYYYPNGLPAGLSAFYRCVLYLPTAYVTLTHSTCKLECCLIYLGAGKGYHLLSVNGTLKTVLTDDTSFTALTDGNWIDSGTVYGYDNHGVAPSGYDDTSLYEFGLGADPTYIPTWIPIIPPTDLTYLENPINYDINISITPNVPSSTGGSVDSYSINQPLPTGLIFDTGTGIITGTPTVVSSLTTYIITATNSGGFTTCNLQISISTPIVPLIASFVTDKTLDFTGNMVKFDASASTGSIVSYEWEFDDGGPPIVTSAVSADYPYTNYGTRNPSLVVYSSSASSSAYSIPLTINPAPVVALSGTPAISSTMNFWDVNGPYYFPGTIEYIEIAFGDGSPSVSGAPIDIFPHIFLSGGAYEITISAFDTSGNTAVGTRTIAILTGDTCTTKSEYIGICGPDNRRFGPCKDINLTNFLPDYLQETDVFTLTKFFEDFLNTMYSGLCGMQITETLSATDPNSVLSATDNTTIITYTAPTQNLSTDPRISILEKIKRLADLHDPDLIDAQYLQFFASYLGYNVPISRNEIGGFGLFGSQDTVCSASDSEKYLRFTVSELPHWYKIKTTNNMILVMLYSFGLIGDIAQYYTSDYDGVNFQNWKLDDSKKLAGIPDTWFPTPHFAALIDIDLTIKENPESQNILNLLIQQGDKIIRAITSVKPINTVFHGLAGLTTELLDLYIGIDARFSEYLRIDYDGPADWWI